LSKIFKRASPSSKLAYKLFMYKSSIPKELHHILKLLSSLVPSASSSNNLAASYSSSVAYNPGQVLNN